MKNCQLLFIALSISVLVSRALFAAEIPGSAAAVTSTPPRKVADLIYKTVGEQSLKLDLYLPKRNAAPAALVIWIHGGGWRAGSKNDVPILPLTSEGFAVASIDYRLSGQAAFPAQIEDAKAAIRWLRVHAKEYGIDPDHFGVIGHSAGAHLASLVGVTGRGSAFDVGENLDISSAVQAVCVMSGPSDMVVMFNGADENRRSALVALFGGSLPEKRKLAETASPINYVGSGVPPFLFVHGAEDQTVPVEQAKMMNQKLTEAGANPKLIILPQTGHDVFARPNQYAGEIKEFFAKVLKGE